MKRSIAVLSITLLFLACIEIFVTCAKEYSYEGGNGTSEYTFAGAPNECAEAVVSGTYYAGDTLTASNTVTLKVDVIRTGSFNIQTNKAGGMYFTATGNFTDTGVQVISLTGAGIADSIGAFTMQVPNTSSCYFTITVEEKPKAVFTLTGDPTDCTNPEIKGNYTQLSSTSGLNNVTLNVFVSSPGTYFATTDTVDGISFSAKGSFTVTGDQTIVLIASGDIADIGFQYFTVTAGDSHCSFIIPVTNNQPFATYVLESYSTQAICANASLSGTCRQGVALTDVDYFFIQVYITDVGNYSVGTKPVNGMSFYGLGRFTSTGEQLVQLKGHGTPINSGTFLLTPEILGPSPLGGELCSINVKVQ